MVPKSYDPETMTVAAEYPFAVSVQSAENLTGEMTDWCGANCVHYWMLGPMLPVHVFEMWTYYFAFEDEQDAMFFKLRWK